MTAAELLKSKAHQAVHTITPGASVFDAVKLMADKNIGALLVIEGERIAGIITERDYARKIVLMSRSSKETPVREIMTSAVMYVRPGQTSEECMVLMTENRLRHLPVMDGTKLLGLISIGDLVKGIISEQKFIIEQLEHYIRRQRLTQLAASDPGPGLRAKRSRAQESPAGAGIADMRACRQEAVRRQRQLVAGSEPSGSTQAAAVQDPRSGRE